MSKAPDLKVRLIRYGEGPRHQRLRAIWEAVAEYEQAHLRVRWFHNPQLRHGQALNKIWTEEYSEPEEFLLLTEEDFLPNLKPPAYRPVWTGIPTYRAARDTRPGLKALGVRYATRNPENRDLQWRPDMAGAWFILIHKPGAPRELDFDGRPDPANQLPRQIPLAYLRGWDGYPLHYGIEYPVGAHLFWSRHLHDPPQVHVSGFPLGDIQRRHDRAVTAWLSRQPGAFRALFRRRFPALAPD